MGRWSFTVPSQEKRPRGAHDPPREASGPGQEGPAVSPGLISALPWPALELGGPSNISPIRQMRELAPRAPGICSGSSVQGREGSKEHGHLEPSPLPCTPIPGFWALHTVPALGFLDQ